MNNTLLALCTLLLMGVSAPAFARQKTGDKTTSNTVSSNDTLARMLELSAPNEHHRLLGALAGEWKFQDAKLSFVKGTIVRKPIYDGRFYTVTITGGRLQVPVANGKMKEDNYQGFQLEGYDNGLMAFVSTSVNNHIGSDIQYQTGSYDSATKTFTYYWQSDLLKGYPVKNKKTLKVVDANRYTEEYFEEEKNVLVKVRELRYTRVE